MRKILYPLVCAVGLVALPATAEPGVAGVGTPRRDPIHPTQNGTIPRMSILATPMSIPAFPLTRVAAAPG